LGYSIINSARLLRFDNREAIQATEHSKPVRLVGIFLIFKSGDLLKKPSTLPPCVSQHLIQA